jgi:hypothetical protein
LLIRLEKHLDLLLVSRSQRGLALTDAGRNISYPVKEPSGSRARDASFSINIVPVHPVQEPKEDIKVFVKVRAPKDSSRRVESSLSIR